MQSVRIKICGITNIEDALVSEGAGADALGFVFYDKSPRRVTGEGARDIIKRLGPFVSRVAVFVDESIDRIKTVVDETGIDCVQLHGVESPEFCSRLKDSLGVKVIKAVRVKDDSDVAGLKPYDVHAFLLDTYRQGVKGGTGEIFDWDIALMAKGIARVILAGGLRPENVASAVQKVFPYGVDVSSGVEISPGRKDRGRVAAFIKNARKAFETDEKTA
ncbi:MAG: phosphoribosylanthranilate isomerase [Deltaproteobacteria bacterium]|nr:phosphoribosylanthranilate isomerase [Deltaproteobacteria bacterium]